MNNLAQPDRIRLTRRFIERQMGKNLSGPQRLILGVLLQAIQDLGDREPVIRSDAGRYLGSAGFEYHCSLLGLEHDAITLGLQQAGLVETSDPTRLRRAS